MLLPLQMRQKRNNDPNPGETFDSGEQSSGKRRRGKGNCDILSSPQPGTHRGSVNLSEAGYNLQQRDAWGDHGALSPVVLVVD